jgi:hypothetical protein
VEEGGDLSGAKHVRWRRAARPLTPRRRQLLTVPQVAEQFQVTAQTIRN